MGQKSLPNISYGGNNLGAATNRSSFCLPSLCMSAVAVVHRFRVVVGVDEKVVAHSVQLLSRMSLGTKVYSVLYTIY
jgi:hypothetical protein